MKTAISIPDPVFRSAEELAARLGVSRSELYATAIASLVESHREDILKARLNEVYEPGDDSSSLAADVVSIQSRSLKPEKW